MPAATLPRQRNPGGGRPRKPKTPLPANGSAVLLFDSKPGLRAAIDRLHQAEIRAAQDYQLAQTTGDAALISQQKKTWLDLIEQLRKVEVSTPDTERANAATVPIAEVESETARLCGAFRVALEALPRSLPQRLVGQDLPTIQETLAKAVADALSRLHEGKWKEPK